MNREIKFRIWDGKSMEYIEDFYWFEENSFHSCDSDERTLMQYTGLKDKKGIEIYEGDKVKRADNVSGEVKFGRHLFEGTARASQGYYFGEFHTLDGSLEVIGNIYEGVKDEEN